MEQQYEYPSNTPQPNNLYVDEEVKFNLYSAAKWAKFLAIVGFVGVGFLILLAFFISPILEEAAKQNVSGENPLANINGTFVTIIYLAFASLYFFPCLFLYRFSVRMLNALTTTNQASLGSSFSQLKACFKFVGGIVIVLLSLYGLIIIGAIAAAIISH